MRIGIDVRSLSRPKTGIGYYTYNLVKNLLIIDNQNEYFLYSCRDFDCELLKSFKNVTVRISKFKIGTLWVQIVLPFLLARDKLDIFHSTEAMAPLFVNCPVVVTVLDLIPILFPKGHDPKANLAAKLYPLVFKRAQKLISISDNTKRDLIRVMGMPAAKIKTIYLSANREIYHPVEDHVALSAIKSKYGLGEKYVLTVGVLSPRKNVGRLVEAYDRARIALAEKIDLVVAGPPGWQYEEVYETVDKLGLKASVHFLGAVPLEDLPGLYNAAEMLVYPSLYEGFGLPVVEAMACGIPVITSNLSSLPEVAGDAALLVDPYNVAELAEVMARLLEDNKLRAEMVERGLKRAELFSWVKCASETLKTYREVHDAVRRGH